MKKVIYLFLALLLPGLIFVFLKYAGKNKFDIPVYFENGVSGPCLLPDSRPYRVPDSLWHKEGLSRKVANVVIFPWGSLDVGAVETAINEELGKESVSFLDGSLLSPDSLVRRRWKTCIFMIEDPMQTVLVDKEGRIRGFYDLRIRDEMDRLRVELKIVLQRY